MTTQTLHAGASPLAIVAANAVILADDPVLSTLLMSGRRGSAPHTLVTALTNYWQCLVHREVSQRKLVVERLRCAIRAGETTRRAWIAVALGDCEQAIVREAVLGYLGEAPVSVERRQCALTDVLEWIRRDLSLNRVAVFATLLQLGDAACNDRLRRLRGLLSVAEMHAVWLACAKCDAAITREFVADWQAWV